MTNKEVIEIVYKAKMVKPYAKVHFPYSVQHVERILGISFNDDDRADMQRFFDTAEFYASHNTEDYHCANQLYHVIIGMVYQTDFFSVKEATLIYNSIVKSCKFKVYMSDVLNFRFNGSNELWTISSKESNVFEVNPKKIRRQINLANLFGEEVEEINLTKRNRYREEVENDETL